MIDKLKEIAENFGMSFNYGREHWQNLIDVDDTTQCLLWWVDEQDYFNEFGAVDKTEYTSEFYIVKKSNIYDTDYNEKYETRIKELKDKAKLIQDEFRNCSGFTLKSWKMTEVENQLDANLDGVKISITLQDE